MRLPRRSIDDLVAKHFQGTPEQRVVQAWRLGREALEIFLATQPPGTTREEALRILRRNTHRGRRPSRAMDAARG